jgi:uncharacterized membrane protein (DUF441 family)
MNRELIKKLLIGLATSKTINFNAIMAAIVGLLLTWLNSHGVTGLTEDDIMKLLVLVAGVVGPLGNVVIRFFTKKPLAEKTSYFDR